MASDLRPQRKPKPMTSNAASTLGRSSSRQGSQMPSNVTPVISKPAHAAAVQPPPSSLPPSESSAPHKQAGPSPAEKASTASSEMKSPAGSMQNPFAAESQKKPIEGQANSRQPSQPGKKASDQALDDTSEQREGTNQESPEIGTALASAKTPGTLGNPFAEQSSVKKPSQGPSSDGGSEGQSKEALSIGTAIDADSASSQVKSEQPFPTDMAMGEGPAQLQGSASEDAPSHSPAISAFEAPAKKSES